MKYGISCQQSKGGKSNEDAYRAIPFKVGRRNSVISFTHFQEALADDDAEGPLAKRRKLDKLDEILRSKEGDSTPPYDSSTSNSTSVSAIISSSSISNQQEIEKPLSSKGEVSLNCSSVPTNYAFFAVYDGHGGPQAADLARNTLHGKIVNHPDFKADPEKAIREAFHQLETQFTVRDCANNRSIHGVGTTAVVALIATDSSATSLYIAHVGDSEAVMCRNGAPFVLAEPHNLKNPREKERVLACGGKIHKERLAHPVWNPGYMNIAVTRAIGDLYFKSEEYTDGKASGLIAEPEINKYELTTEDEFIILASDGFWDVVSKEKAIEFVKKYPRDYDVNLLCKELTDYAINLKTLDDTTVLVVKLRN